jgi:CIC family chloride channel protein
MLFIPLMITAVFSYMTIMYFEKHSLYHKRLAQRGELLTHHKDKTVLTLMKLNSVIENDFEKINPDWYLGDLVKVIATSKRNIYPVVESDNKLVGIVLLDDIRNIMFRPEKYNTFKVKKLMVLPPDVINVGQAMEEVMNAFEKTGAWNLPVVDENGSYMGFVSKSKIFNAYRKVLVHFSDE